VSQQWRIRVHGKPRKKPDVALLVRAVLALGEQMGREAKEDAAALPDTPNDAPKGTI
jgi:hypothetical protein